MRNTTLVGDCREGLVAMREAGITAQCCVTSPPYWGLRDYGTAEWHGGDPDCTHIERTGGTARSTLGAYGNSMSQEVIDRQNAAMQVPYRDVCRRCGARRVDRQIGLETTPDDYLANIVEVFRLVRDVLADDGALWLNIGDSYAGAPGGGQGKNGERADRSFTGRIDVDKVVGNLKPKDLVGIPWMLAFALRADGWYLRQDIIWHKPNPMPESVGDRCTKAHEYLFLLTKSRRYYWDAAAMLEPVSGTARPRGDGVNPKAAAGAMGSRQNGSFSSSVTDIVDERNRRSVWTVPTQPYSGAHFAVFPPKLIEPCILATSRPGDIVLDPFMGSGTTAQVAQALGRDWIGCELNPEYSALQLERTAQSAMPL